MDELSLEGPSWEALPFKGPRRERLWGASEARAVPGRVLAAAAGEAVLGRVLAAAAWEAVLGRPGGVAVETADSAQDAAARVADSALEADSVCAAYSARAGISQITRTL